MVNVVGRTEVGTVMWLVPEPSAFKVGIEKLKRYELLGIDHIPAELNQS